jgi:hypothetical protein
VLDHTTPNLLQKLHPFTGCLSEEARLSFLAIRPPGCRKNGY